MNFHFNEEEQEILDMLHDFCLKEVAPIAAEIDEEERFPEETWHKLAEMGMMGVPFAEEYGGAGLSYLTYIGVCEELAKHCATTSVMVSAHSSLCCWPISEFGTEEQKQKYLPPLCSGEKLGAFGLTEPGAGTDSAMQKTVAEDKGDHWLLNGSKIFITNAGYAETFVVFAMTDKEKGNKGISAFIVEKGFPGFKVGAHEKKMGIRGSSTCELIFEDCVVPKENLLGELGKGFKIAMMTLDGGRIGIGAQALGIAQAAIVVCQVHHPAYPVRQAHQPVPEHPVPAGGHAGPCGRRPAADLSRRPGQAGPRALQPPGGHGQAVRLRGGQQRHPPLPAAGRRLRLHPGVSL